MMIIRNLMRLPLLSRFAADCRAVAATEMALILPVMLAVYLGSIEASQMISADRKTSLATRTVSDLVSRLDDCKSSTPPSEITGVFKATDAVIAPFDPADLSVVVTCIAIDKNGGAKVMWSKANRGTPRTGGDTFIPPTGVGDGLSTTYWVLGEADYTYRPITRYVLTGTYKLHEQAFMNSRL